MYENIIAIPYRKREKHLDYFIKNTVPLIEKHMPNTKIVVIEQNEGKLFNRGAILNVAFKEYENKTKYFLTHDVDLNPTEILIKNTYNKNINDKEVFAIYTSAHQTLGGIIKITNNSIKKINGFPNNMWGWGVEDKALQNRTEYFGIHKIRKLYSCYSYPQYILRFDDINDRVRHSSHDKRHHHHNILFKKQSKEKQLQEIMSSGLNNLKYNVFERKQLHKIVELIKVDI